MSDAIIVAIVTGCLTLIGTIITVLSANKQTIATLDKRSEVSDKELEGKLEKWKAVIDTKLENLTHTVEKHNQIVERTYKLEGAVKEIQHDIQDLKSKT